MAQLNWSEPARNDLEEILKAGDRLMLMPAMGPKEPLLEQYKRNYRYVVVLRHYKIIYLYENNVCSILMIWDCRQNPNALENNDRFKS